MKLYSKVIYKTDKGISFKTIVPVSEMSAYDYMSANYSNIEILSIKPSNKKKYTKFCNVRIKN